MRECMGPENGVAQVQVFRSLLEFKKIGFDGFQMLLGLDNKVGKDFRIVEILVHRRPTERAYQPNNILTLRRSFSGWAGLTMYRFAPRLKPV